MHVYEDLCIALTHVLICGDSATLLISTLGGILLC